MNCVSCDICVPIWVVLCFSVGYSSASSRVTGACSVTTDLIMRVNVRTTITTTMTCPESHAALQFGFGLRYFMVVSLL